MLKIETDIYKIIINKQNHSLNGNWVLNVLKKKLKCVTVLFTDPGFRNLPVNVICYGLPQFIHSKII